jgi:hypothetical protein
VKKMIVAKFKDMKTGSNPAESSKEDYGSKGSVLLMMMMTTYRFCALHFFVF